MIRLAAFVPLLLTLAGCAGPSVSQTTASDGHRAYVASCGGIGGSGLFGSPLDCRLAATKGCPPGSGYVPIEEVPGGRRLTFRCAAPNRRS